MGENEVRKCFNKSCGGEVEVSRLWNGWRMCNGEYSSLCERCVSLYEEGRYCEVFHSQAGGWVPCEACNKLIHCGCIVSSQAFTLLDAGGIECITCAKTSGRLVLPLNLTCSPSLPPYGTPLSTRIKDLSTKSVRQFPITGPAQWLENPNLYNSHMALSGEHVKMSDDAGLSNRHYRYNDGEVFSLSTLEKRRQEFNWPLSRIAHTSEINQKIISGVPQKMLPDKEVASNMKPETLLPNSLGNVSNSEIEASGCHSQNGLHGDEKGKNYLLAPYLPKTTDEELQQVAGSTEIKPLFEKTLSASDAGRIGRLVVPKICAEAYFPHISHPEGLPLEVQDVNGKEWVFQFRYWPNNKSRIYVLEGVCECLQSLQLQAGDRVTFSRVDPEGKIVMGFRKVFKESTNHEDEANKRSNNESRINMNLSKADKSGYIAKSNMKRNSGVYRNRKGNTISYKERHLLCENLDQFELKITLEEAQRLIRPSHSDLSQLGMVANEIEEYEDCPVIGRPTIFTTDQIGESIQWAQCEDCLKWRRLPADALLPAKWTCSNNTWYSNRCTCTSPQDISADQLDDLLFSINQSASKKLKTHNQDVDTETEGHDTLANVAILGDGKPAASPGRITTKHPRHRNGCSCIVCIQPPSGKGLKHKHTCECAVCLALKRRFQTLMLRRERKLHEKEAEATSEKHLNKRLLVEKSQENEPPADKNLITAQNLEEASGEGSVDMSCGKNSSGYSLKVQIDLNMQPESDDLAVNTQQ